MLQRGGEVIVRMLANVQQPTLKPLILGIIAPGTTAPVMTWTAADGWKEWRA